MDAVIYTKSIPEYEMLSGILEEESPGITVSRGVIDREYHLEREYDVVVVGINGALGMELVCKYRELYGNTLVIWITDDPYFARVAIRTHSFDFIVRPLEGTRFREPLRRIKEGDIAVWQTAAIWKHSRVPMSIRKNAIKLLRSVCMSIRTSVIRKRRKQKQAQGKEMPQLLMQRAESRKTVPISVVRKAAVSQRCWTVITSMMKAAVIKKRRNAAMSVISVMV